MKMSFQTGPRREGYVVYTRPRMAYLGLGARHLPRGPHPLLASAPVNCKLGEFDLIAGGHHAASAIVASQAPGERGRGVVNTDGVGQVIDAQRRRARWRCRLR